MKFREWFENRHEYAREWKKRTGGKVVGYFCSYVPEEILYGAGILPVRIFGAHQATSVTEPYILSNISCSFCRDCLAQAIQGRYDYLDGLVMAQTCTYIEQVFRLWEEYFNPGFTYFLWFPQGLQSVGRYEYYSAELAAFKEAVEKWIGKEITNEDIDRGIEVYNTNRRLTRQVYEYRKKDKPPLLGSEAFEVVMSSQVTDKAEHSEELKRMLDELPMRKVERETGVRLMIAGSVNDDIPFIRRVEEELTIPATFVIEDHCTGLRYCYNEVTPRADRLMALAIRYIHRPPCPHKDWPRRRRYAYVLQLYREYFAEAMILMHYKFCNPHIITNITMSEFLKEQGIPVQRVENDVTMPAKFTTIMEAFLESQVELV